MISAGLFFSSFALNRPSSQTPGLLWRHPRWVLVDRQGQTPRSTQKGMAGLRCSSSVLLKRVPVKTPGVEEQLSSPCDWS